MPGIRSSAEPSVRNQLLAMGAFRSKTAIKIAASYSMAKRTADNLIKEMVESGELRAVQRGIYIPPAFLKNKFNALQSIAHTFQAGGVTSLDSSFPFAKDGRFKDFYLVVPKGKTGSLQFGEYGSVHILNSSKRMADQITDRVGSNNVFNESAAVPTHTKEMAFTIACYLSDLCVGKSKYAMGQIIQNGEDLDYDLVRDMGMAARLPDRIMESAIERSLSNDDSPSPF